MPRRYHGLSSGRGMESSECLGGILRTRVVSRKGEADRSVLGYYRVSWEVGDTGYRVPIANMLCPSQRGRGERM